MPELIQLKMVEFSREEGDHRARVEFYFGEGIDQDTGEYDTLVEEMIDPPEHYTTDQIVTRAALRLGKRLEKAAAFLSQKYGRED